MAAGWWLIHETPRRTMMKIQILRPRILILMTLILLLALAGRAVSGPGGLNVARIGGKDEPAPVLRLSMADQGSGLKGGYHETH